MNSIDNFPKKFVISVVSKAKPKNIVAIAFAYVLESFALFYDDFCMDLYSVDSDEAIKKGNEALNALSLQFLSSIKHFIAPFFFSALNALLPLLFMKKHSLTLHGRYFL
jgi:hypothetical protein